MVSWCDCSLAYSCKWSCSACVTGKTQYAFWKRINKNGFFLLGSNPNILNYGYMHFHYLLKMLLPMYLRNISQAWWSQNLPIIQGFLFPLSICQSLKNLGVCYCSFVILVLIKVSFVRVFGWDFKSILFAAFLQTSVSMHHAQFKSLTSEVHQTK